MGRSVPTYRMKLEELIGELAPYRRALREEDRHAFDALMNRARRYASASGYQAPADPLDTALLSMLLGLEKELAEMKRKLQDGEGGPPNARNCARLDEFDGTGQSGEGGG
jgi:hypothetical protein